jgi:hypothetical protein
VKQKLEPLIDKLPAKTDQQKNSQKLAKICIEDIDGKFNEEYD